MMLVPVRLRLMAVFMTLMFAAGSAQADIIALWDFGASTGETSTTTGPGTASGRVNNPSQGTSGWEATTVDPNATANNAFLSDSIPPSNEDYIEITSPSYADAAGNQFPVLRLEPGNNSTSPAQAIQEDKFFQLTVSANGGRALNLSSLEFDAARGGDATPRGWAVLSSVDGYANIVDTQEVKFTRPTLTHFKIDLSGPQYQGLSSVSFRLFTYLPCSFPGNCGRSIEYSNVTIFGKVQ